MSNDGLLVEFAALFGQDRLEVLHLDVLIRLRNLVVLTLLTREIALAGIGLAFIAVV